MGRIGTESVPNYVLFYYGFGRHLMGFVVSFVLDIWAFGDPHFDRKKNGFVNRLACMRSWNTKQSRSV